MKLFEAIVYDEVADEVIKTYGCAHSKKEFKEIYSGNGEFKGVVDVTKEYFNEESVIELDKSLRKDGWGYAERTLLCALLKEHLEKNKVTDIILE